MRPLQSALVALLGLLSLTAEAQAPATFSHQGVVEQNGNRVTATLPFTFRLYAVASGGAALWTESHPSIAVTDGLYSVTLGTTTSLTTVDFGQPLWLDIVVNGAAQNPRTALTSVPSAMSLTPGTMIQGSETTFDAGVIRIENTATTGSGHALRVVGNSFGVAGRFTGPVGGIEGVATITGASAVSGSNSVGYGVSGQGTRGVYGQSFAAAGYGGYFTGNTGVFGNGGSDPGDVGGFFQGEIGVSAGAFSNTDADLILRGFSSTNDDGRIFSDPDYNDSDIWLESGDAVVVVLDRDNNTADSDFFVEVNGTNVFNVDDSGTVSVNGAVVHSSDVHRKERIEPVDPAAVLAEVAAMTIAEWSYRGEATRHLGPMAQDFHAAFGLGETDTGIATVDADGIALAAIQALHQRVQAQDAIIQTLLARLEALEGRPSR